MNIGLNLATLPRLKSPPPLPLKIGEGYPGTKKTGVSVTEKRKILAELKEAELKKAVKL